jgi:hypothetical protein
VFDLGRLDPLDYDGVYMTPVGDISLGLEIRVRNYQQRFLTRVMRT